MNKTRSPFIWRSRVRFVDTDASGRIHYASVLRHFEAAEEEFLRYIGCPYRAIEDRAVAYPRVHVECDYLSAIRYDDNVAIEVSVEKIGRSAFTLGFLAAVDGRPAASGKITIVAMNRRDQRACAIPEQLAERLREYLLPEKDTVAQ